MGFEVIESTVVTNELERIGHCHALSREAESNPVKAAVDEEGIGPGRPEPYRLPGVHIGVIGSSVPSLELLFTVVWQCCVERPCTAGNSVARTATRILFPLEVVRSTAVGFGSSKSAKYRHVALPWEGLLCHYEFHQCPRHVTSLSLFDIT